MSDWLTLSSDHDDGNVGATGAQLAVQLVQLQEAGLVLQTEDQDDGVHPVGELQEEEKEEVDD